MLVLTRHVHQSIVIGQDVVITVLEVRGDQVRLGITAPKDVQVHREEVFAALSAAERQDNGRTEPAASESGGLTALSAEGVVPDATSVAPRTRPGPGVAQLPERPSSPCGVAEVADKSRHGPGIMRRRGHGDQVWRRGYTAAGAAR